MKRCLLLIDVVYSFNCTLLVDDNDVDDVGCLRFIIAVIFDFKLLGNPDEL